MLEVCGCSFLFFFFLQSIFSNVKISTVQNQVILAVFTSSLSSFKESCLLTSQCPFTILCSCRENLEQYPAQKQQLHQHTFRKLTWSLYGRTRFFFSCVYRTTAPRFSAETLYLCCSLGFSKNFEQTLCERCYLFYNEPAQLIFR